MARTSTAPTDEDVQREVLTELKFDAEVRQQQIGVVVDDRVVTLTGRVETLPEKWAAERAALRVRGVKAVANEIEVLLPVGDERTDTDIAAAAAQALTWDVRVPNDAVRVSVSDGWVTLRGEVEWQYQRNAAQRSIRNLTGVREITNLITVGPSETPMPDYVKDRIVSAFIRDVELDAQQISVTSNGGRVTLAGTVRSWAEAAEAERVAWSSPGVTEVDNRIVVRH